MPSRSRPITGQQSHLPPDGSAGLPGRGGLEDPLLLLGGQRGVQGDDLDVARVRAQLLHLPLDPLAGLVDFLEKTRWRWLESRIEGGGWKRGPGK